MPQSSRRRVAARAGVFTAAVSLAAGGLLAAAPASAETPAAPTSPSGIAGVRAAAASAFGQLPHEVPAPGSAQPLQPLLRQARAAAASAAAAPTAAATAAASTSPTLYGSDGHFPDLTEAGGHVWFTQATSTGHYQLHRIESAGVTTTFSLPNDLSQPALFAGPDGNLWAWSDDLSSSYGSGTLARIDADGTVTPVATDVTGQFGGGTSTSSALWLVVGDSALVIRADGVPHSYVLPRNFVVSAGAASANGDLWLVGEDGESVVRVTPDGTVSAPITVTPQLDGSSIGSIEATPDGAAWLSTINGSVAVVTPTLTASTVVRHIETSAWAGDAIALAVGPDPSSIWVLRTHDADANTSEIIHVNEAGTRDVDVTDPYDFSGGYGGPDDEGVFADSAGRLWFGESSWTSDDVRVRMASFTGGKITRYAADEGYDFYYDGFHETSDGRVWAFRTGAPTSGSVDVFDPTAHTVAQYPVKTGYFPILMVFDAAGAPWLSYVRIASADASDYSTYWGSAPTTAVQRVAGADRYATSVAFSKSAFPSGASVVYLASGENFPDGLSAGPAAGAQGGPVLLTAKASVPSSVRSEIARLKPSKIVIVGGTASISATAASQLKGLAASIVRVSGADRYATSAAVALSAFPKGASTVYLANGNTFPDALSAAGAAGADHAPVLLVNGSASTLSASTTQVLKKLGATSIKVLGGTASVSSGIASAAAELGHTTRLAGADRYATSAAVAESTTGADAWKTAYVVSGANFADALSVGAVAAAGGHPILLAQYQGLTSRVSADLGSRSVAKVDVLGGYASLSWAVGGLQVAGTSLVPVD